MKKIGLTAIAILLAFAAMLAACNGPENEEENYIKSFDVPAEAITCMIGETVVVPEIKAVTKDDEEISAEISVKDPNGGAVTLDSRRFNASMVGTYVITYKIVYLENQEESKTRNVVVSPKPAPVLTLINDFESEDDITIDPDGDSVIWPGDNQQSVENYSLNDDPQFVFNGDKSLKIEMQAKSANYWPGVKFLRSNYAATNDFSEYYSVSMMVYNESAQKIWLKLGNPGKDIGLDPNAWTKVEILVSEMAANGISSDNLLNSDGSFYFWFTFETTFMPVNLYVDAVYAQPDDSEIDYDTPADFIKVNSFEVAPNITKNQNETYLITEPVYELTSGTGEIAYYVYAPDGTELKNTENQPFTAGDEIALSDEGVYKVEYVLSFDNGRVRVKSTLITVRAVLVEPKADVLYADFNEGLDPNLADMGAVWANDGASITHNTNADFAKDGGSAKFDYTVAAGQWPSFRFSNGKFPGLNDKYLAGLKKITMEIYNAGDAEIVIHFNTVLVTLQKGWNNVVIEESQLPQAGIDSGFHFFITSNDYTVGDKIELYVDNVWLIFN